MVDGQGIATDSGYLDFEKVALISATKTSELEKKQQVFNVETMEQNDEEQGVNTYGFCHGPRTNRSKKVARTACNLHRVLVIRVIERDMYGAIVQKGYVLSAACLYSTPRSRPLVQVDDFFPERHCIA